MKSKLMHWQSKLRKFNICIYFKVF